MLHLTKRMFGSNFTTTRVAPSGWYYLLNYGINASQVTPTGPRGHVTKADLVMYIQKNHLKLVPQSQPQPQPQSEPKP